MRLFYLLKEPSGADINKAGYQNMSDLSADSAPGGEMDVITATDLPASSGDVVENDAPAIVPDTEKGSADLFEVSVDEFQKVVDDLQAENKPVLKTPETPAAPETEKTDESITETDKPADELAGDTEETKEQTAEEAKEPTPDESRLQWESAPEQFREEHKKIKSELNEIRKNSLEREFLVDAPKFLDTLKTKSESQYQALVQQAATASAQANPEGWIDVFVENYPDLVTQKLFGDEKLTKQRITAERDIVQENYGEIFEDWQDENAKPALAPAELTELEQLRQQQKLTADEHAQSRRAALESRIAEPITDTVNRAFRDAHLEVDPNDTPEEKGFKEFLNNFMPVYIGHELSTNEEIAPIFNQVNKLIEAGDEAGAKNLQFPLLTFVENLMDNITSFSTGILSKAEKARTIPLATVPPPKVINASAGGAPLPVDSIFSTGFDVDDAEWTAAARLAS